MKITVVFVASIYTAAAIVGLIGYGIKLESDLECSPSIPRFLGAVFRRNRFIKTYYILLCFATGFQFAAGIWYLVTFYKTRNQTFYQCVNGSTDPTIIDYCNSLKVYKTIPQGYVIAQAIVPLLIQLCKFPIVLL